MKRRAERRGDAQNLRRSWTEAASDFTQRAPLALAVDWAVWRLATRGGAQGLRGPAGMAPARRGTGLAL